MSEAFTSPDWYRVAEARLALRREARIDRHLYLGRPWYVLSDSTGGKVHRLSPAAYAFVGRLDGTRTVDEVWRAVVGDLAVDAPAQSEIVHLLSQLHSADLLSGPQAPFLEDMIERRDRDRRQVWMKMFLNPLSATLPLVDPNRFLARVVAIMSVLPPVAWWGLLVALVAPAAVLLPANWPALANRGIDGLLDLENLALIACIYPIVKAVHETGHGVTTRSRGGEVHEMGVMFIALYPIPYVEASASLAFPSKWSRAAVAAAGVAVELGIAAVAFYVWLIVEPGTLRSIAFNTMLISGFSTVAVNGNPLLRFDGYHVLCDLIEIPNLGKRGNAWWGEVLRTRLLGTRERDRPATCLWERIWFVFYPPAAFVYRIFISLTIALFVAGTYWLLGLVLAVWSLVLSFVWPFVKLVRKTVTDQRIRAAGWRAIGAGSAAVAALAVALFVVPLPHRTIAQAVVWLPPESLLRAGADGFVESVNASFGESVASSEPLVILRAEERAAAIAQAEARVARARSALEATQFSDRASAVVWQSELRNGENALADAKRRADDLVLRAGADGAFAPSSERNLVGRFFREGDVVAHVLPGGPRTVRVVMRQQDADLFASGLRGIEVRFAHDPGRIYRAEVVREVPAGTSSLPSSVLAVGGGGRFATTEGPRGEPIATRRVFQFDIKLEKPPAEPPPFGMRAFVRLDFEPATFASQIGREIRQLVLSVFDV